MEVQAAQNVYASLAATRAATYTATEDRNSASQPRDTVEISQEAKDLAAGSSGAGGQDLPLEAYSIPEWYAELMTDYTRVDTEIGVPYLESRAAKYDALSGGEKADLSEYLGKLHEYFQEELRARGIETTEDYYERIVRDQQNSEEVHQAVRQKLMGDERAMHMAEYFGVSV